MLQLHEQLVVHVNYMSMLDSCEMILLIGQDILSEAGNKLLHHAGSGRMKLAKFWCRLKLANANLGFGTVCACTAHKMPSYQQGRCGFDCDDSA